MLFHLSLHTASSAKYTNINIHHIFVENIRMHLFYLSQCHWQKKQQIIHEAIIPSINTSESGPDIPSTRRKSSKNLFILFELQ